MSRKRQKRIYNGDQSPTTADGHDSSGNWINARKWGMSLFRRARQNMTMQFVFRLFVVGLLFQFFAHTLVTFERGRDGSIMQIVRLWKELLIIGLVLWGCRLLITGQRDLWTIVRGDRVFHRLGGAMLVTMILSFVGSVWITDAGSRARLVAAKYNIFPMVIMLVWYVIGRLQGRDRVIRQLRWVARVASYLLIWALLWYVIVGLKPGVLKFFGYNPGVFEGVVGEAPPAAYLSLYDHGNMRNQFLFERPIIRGFYLVMLFPLFFVRYLRRHPLSQVWGWWLLYAFAIAVTFSRAAWGVWLVLVVLMMALTYRRQGWKYIAGAMGVGAVAIVGLMTMYDGRLLIRDFSDKGHLYALQDSMEMIGDSPLWGQGAGTAGPASHQLHEEGFNPENQFLQIIIEYGLIGFLPWMVFFGILLSQGVLAYSQTPRHESDIKKHPQTIYPRYVVAVVVGLLGLGIEGLVLHSFADRMVMYPLMAMVGLAIGAMYSINHPDSSTRLHR